MRRSLEDRRAPDRHAIVKVPVEVLLGGKLVVVGVADLATARAA